MRVKDDGLDLSSDGSREAATAGTNNRIGSLYAKDKIGLA